MCLEHLCKVSLRLAKPSGRKMRLQDRELWIYDIDVKCLLATSVLWIID